MKKIIVMLAVLAVIVTAAVLPTSAAQNYCVAFEEKMNDFVLFNLTPLGQEFNAKTVIVYTYSKLDLEDYGVGEENAWGYYDQYSVPAAEFESKAASLFGNVDAGMISRMRSAVYEDIGMYGYSGTAYDSATNSYVFYPSDGFGTSYGYVIFGYTQSTSSYTGYFYYVDTYYEKADGDSLNVDYIINPNFTGTDDMYYELLAKVKVVFEYNGSGEIKLVSISETDNFIASGLILPTTDPDNIPEPGTSSDQSSSSTDNSSSSETQSSQPENTSSSTPSTSSSEISSSENESSAPQPTESSSEQVTSSEAPSVSSETGSADATVSDNSSSDPTSSSGTSTENLSSVTQSTDKTTGADKSDKSDSDKSDENDDGNSALVTVIIIVAAVVLLGGGGFAGYMFALKKANRH